MIRHTLALAVLAACTVIVLLVPASAAEFDVVFDTPKPLGLRLDATLAVQGFVRGGTGPGAAKLPAESTGWLRVGDRLVAVNGARVDGRAAEGGGADPHLPPPPHPPHPPRPPALAEVTRMIAEAGLPKRLRFAAANNADRSAEMARIAAEEEAAVLGGGAGGKGHGGSTTGVGSRAAAAAARALLMGPPEGTLELWRGGLRLGSLPYSQALFGGPTSCRPAPLILAHPRHGCFAHPAHPALSPSSAAVSSAVASSASSALLPGSTAVDAYVVAERGECPFTLKALQAQQAGALGLVVINDEAGTLRMPSSASPSSPLSSSSSADRGRGGGPGGQSDDGGSVSIAAVMVGGGADGDAFRRILAAEGVLTTASASAAAAAAVSSSKGPAARNTAASTASSSSSSTSVGGGAGGAAAAAAAGKKARPLMARFVRKGQVCKASSLLSDPSASGANKIRGALPGEEGDADGGEEEDGEEGVGGGRVGAASSSRIGDPSAPAGELFFIRQNACAGVPLPALAPATPHADRRRARPSPDLAAPSAPAEGRYTAQDDEETRRGGDGLHHHVDVSPTRGGGRGPGAAGGGSSGGRPGDDGIGLAVDENGLPTDPRARAFSGGSRARRALIAHSARAAAAHAEEDAEERGDDGAGDEGDRQYEQAWQDETIDGYALGNDRGQEEGGRDAVGGGGGGGESVGFEGENGDGDMDGDMDAESLVAVEVEAGGDALPTPHMDGPPSAPGRLTAAEIALLDAEAREAERQRHTVRLPRRGPARRAALTSQYATPSSPSSATTLPAPGAALVSGCGRSPVDPVPFEYVTAGWSAPLPSLPLPLVIPLPAAAAAGEEEGEGEGEGGGEGGGEAGPDFRGRSDYEGGGGEGEGDAAEGKGRGSRETGGAAGAAPSGGGRPQDGCSPLYDPFGDIRGSALLLARGGCAFGVKRAHAAAAGAALLVVSNDDPSGPIFSMTAVGDPPAGTLAGQRGGGADKKRREGGGRAARQVGGAASGVGGGALAPPAAAPLDPRALPAVMVSHAAGSALRSLAAAYAEETGAAANARRPMLGAGKGSGRGGGALPGGGADGEGSGGSSHFSFLLDPASPRPLLLPFGRPALAPLWAELASLADPAGWPESAPERRRLFLRLSRLHHPDRSTGSKDRFELLAELHKRAQAKWDPQGRAAAAAAAAPWGHAVGEEEFEGED